MAVADEDKEEAEEEETLLADAPTAVAIDAIHTANVHHRNAAELSRYGLRRARDRGNAFLPALFPHFWVVASVGRPTFGSCACDISNCMRPCLPSTSERLAVRGLGKKAIEVFTR